MTAKEKAQPHIVFVEAGKKSFQIGVHIMNNPYPLQPFHTLWEKGYRKAKRTYDEVRFAAQRKEASGDQVAVTAPKITPAPVPNTAQPVKNPRKPFVRPENERVIRTKPVRVPQPTVYRTGTIGSVVGTISLRESK